MPNKDYYNVLGISKTATESEVKNAYRKLAQKYHPDKKGGDEAKFKEINEAYQILSNKQKRDQYDRFGSTFSGSSANNAGWSGFSSQGFGGSVNFEDLGDFSDIFESFFGGGRSSRRKTYRRGRDLQITQEITLEQAYTGVTKELEFKTFGVCKECEGYGYEVKEGTKKCEVCNGQGEIREVRQSFLGSVQQVKVCSACQGSGEIPHKVCKTCSGAGRVEERREQKIEIIPGVSNGQLIKVSGAGEVGEKRAAAGDLYIQIVIKPHKDFKREGADLFIKKEVSLVDVLLNKKIQVPTIEGKSLEVEIPAGFNFTEKHRLASKGMPNLHGRGHGDLFVLFEVRKPKKVDPKLKKFLEELE